MGTATASNNTPGAVANSPGKLARQDASELGQHQVDGPERDLQHLGPERHRHQRAGQKPSNQLRQLSVGAALGGHPVYQLAGEDQPVQILVGNHQCFLEHQAEALPWNSSGVDGLILNQQSNQAEQLLVFRPPARAQECPDLDVSDMASGGDVSLVANENLP